MKTIDVLIIGAGAAGLFAAITAAKHGAQVLVLEKNGRAGNKILISGGGRCNFTNLYVTPANYVSDNPHFCKSALKQFTQHDFIDWVKQHRITFHEKHKGQLFCDHSSRYILESLQEDCAKHHVTIKLAQDVLDVDKTNAGFKVTTASDVFTAKSVIISTGGLSFKRLGVSGFGYSTAQKFGHTLIDQQPALVPLKLSKSDLSRFGKLSGLSLPVEITTPAKKIHDDLLFTHTGLSGPAILTASNYCKVPGPLSVNLLPEQPLPDARFLKSQHGKKHLENFLAKILPARLAESLCEFHNAKGMIEQLSDKVIQGLFQNIHNMSFNVSAFDSYDKAEVTRGGVSTDQISSKSMESKLCKGLYFVGEVLDVTGDLGGFNFQWAWSSGFVAGLDASSKNK